MNKEKKKILRRKLAWFFLRAFTAICGGLSLKASYKIGEAVADVAYLFAVRHRRIAIDSLSVAFPHKSRFELKKIEGNECEWEDSHQAPKPRTKSCIRNWVHRMVYSIGTIEPVPVLSNGEKLVAQPASAYLQACKQYHGACKIPEHHE